MKQFIIGAMGNKVHLIVKALTEEITDKLNCRWVHLLHHKDILRYDLDIVFCLSYYKLIKPKYFNHPRFGTFVVHASDLPKGRGWAPVSWALLNQEDKIHVTSIKIDEGCDTGPIYKKTNFPVDITDTHKSVYKKVDQEIVKHLECMLSQIALTGNVKLYEQVGEPTWNPRRTPNDSELDINKSLKDLWPLIRACDNINFPAFFKLNGKKIYLKYEVESGI